MNEYRRSVLSKAVINLSDGRQVQGVSRILSVKNRAYESILFMQGRPVMDSDLNSVQAILNHKVSDFANSIVSDGWFKSAPVARDSNDASVAIISAFDYLFDGHVIRFDDGQGYLSINMGPKVQQASRNDLIVAYIFKEEVAAPGENTRLREQIKLHGNLRGVSVPSDLLDPALPDALPTTRRIQVSYVLAQVGTESPINSPVLNVDGQIIGGLPLRPYGDGHKFIAGNGDAASAEAIGSIDGYVYVLPLFTVNRTSADTGLDAGRFTNRVPRIIFNLGISERPELGIEGGGLQNTLEGMMRLLRESVEINAVGLGESAAASDEINQSLQRLVNYLSSYTP